MAAPSEDYLILQGLARSAEKCLEYADIFSSPELILEYENEALASMQLGLHMSGSDSDLFKLHPFNQLEQVTGDK